MASNDSPIKQGSLDEDEIHYHAPGITYVNGKPQSSKLPALEDMNNLSVSELHSVLQHYKIFGPFDKYIMDSMSYVSKMTNYAPDSIAYKKAVTDLLDMSSQKALVGLARRSSEIYSTIESIDGNLEAELIWVSNDDNSTCPACENMDGQIHTYLEWQKIGTPGASVCAGGNSCRCSLILVSNS